MAEQDREKFERHLSKVQRPGGGGAIDAWSAGEEAPRDGATALSAAFQVRMRDGSGIPMSVEVFGVRFDRDGTSAYFVGIREFMDADPAASNPGFLKGRRGVQMMGRTIPPTTPTRRTEGVLASRASGVTGHLPETRAARETSTAPGYRCWVPQRHED